MLGLTRCDIADVRTICCLLYCVKQNALEITQTQQHLQKKETCHENTNNTYKETKAAFRLLQLQKTLRSQYASKVDI